MRIKNQQIVPIAFWVGFLALGLATGLAGHDEHGGQKGAIAKAHGAKTAKINAPVIAQDN